MYDADYLNRLREEAKNIELKTPAMDAGHPPDFVTKDSGAKAHHSDGVVRDTDAGKPRFDLMFPKGVPFDDQLMTRVAELYERGGQIYGMRNWEKSDAPETLEHHEAALMRHVVRFLTGVEDGEDHAAAVVWNVNAVDLCRRNIRLKKPASVFPEHLMPGEEVLFRKDLGDGVTMEIDPSEREAPPEWAKHSAKCCGEPVHSSLPFTYSDGCGRGEVGSVPLHDIFKSYTFPYVGKDSASTGRYCAKEIQAENYEAAKREFDLWERKQPFYNMPGRLW